MKHSLILLLLSPIISMAQPFHALLDLKTPGAHASMNSGDGNPIPNNEDFTIEFWFRTCGTLEGTAYLLDHRSGTNNEGFELSYNTSTEKFTLIAQSNGVETLLEHDYLLTNMLDGLFRHYVIEYKHSEQRFRLYMNGTLAAQGSNMPHGLNSGSLFIGASNENTSEQFTGEFDDLRITLGLLYDNITYNPPSEELISLPLTTALWNFNQPEGFLNFPDVVSGFFLHGTPEVKVIDPIITTDFISCPGQLLTLDGHTGFNTYNWISPLNTAVPFNAEDPSSFFAQSDSYTLNAFSGNCFYTETIYISVYTPNGSVLPGSTICVGDTAILTAFNANTFSWSGPQIFEGQQLSSAFALPTETSEYYVYMEILPGCGDIDTVTVTVNPNPIIEVIAINDTVCTNFNEVAFLSTFNDIGETFTWVPETGLNCTFCLNPSITITETTTYTITSQSAAGCTSDFTFTIYGEECTAIEEYTQTAPLVFPNPAQHQLFLENIPINSPFIIFDSRGRVIEQSIYSGCINIESLSSGMYWIQFPKLTLSSPIRFCKE